MASRNSGWPVLATLGALAGGDAARPQALPLGAPFQINQGVVRNQDWPQTAIAPDGEFVVVWQSDAYQTDSRNFGRRFDSAGAPIGDEFEISQEPATRPIDVGMDAEGEFVVLWGTSYSGPGSGSPSEAYVRRFDAEAMPLGDAFQVNSADASEYLKALGVAMDPGGDFTVVWDDEGAAAQRFDAEGLPVGANFGIEGRLPEVAPLPGSGFVAVWGRDDDPPETWTLVAQRYDGAGDPVGGLIEVGQHPGGAVEQGHRISTDASGSIVVTWVAYGEPPSWNLYARSFAPDGKALGPPIEIEPPVSGYRWGLDVALAPDGTFVVSWRHLLAGGGGANLNARRLALDGTALGPTFRVDVDESGDPDHGRIAVRDDRLLVTWRSETSTGTDQDGSSIQARIFLLPFFLDGFESGDLARWSSSQP